MARLREKIFVPTAVLAAVVGLTLAVLGAATALDSRALAREVNEVRRANALALAATQAADAEQRWVLSYRFRPDAALAARIAEADARTARLLRDAGALALRPRAAALWEQYGRARTLLVSSRDELLGAIRANAAHDVSLAFERWHLAAERVNALLASFQTYHARLLERTVADLQRRRELALLIAAAAALVGTLVGVAAAVLLARRVAAPIVAMSSAAGRIAEEGLAVPVGGEERNDELGVLARSFNLMTERLTSANARLAEAVRMRDEFISIASHELKTPITALKLQTQSLLRLAARDPSRGIPPERLVEATGRFERSVSRVAALVENMLDVSRLTTGQLALRVQEVAVRDLVREAADRMTEELAQAGCTVRVECDSPAVAAIDRSRLDQVLMNLISNAARYAPRNPVVVRCRADEGELAIEVEDRGPGIPPEHHERIFGRFERAAADGSAQAGLGLGLYISREIARAHGGELSVRSDPGAGATFVLRLPLRPAPARAARQAIERGPSGT